MGENAVQKLVLVVGLALAFAGSALAGNGPSSTVYGNKGANVVKVTNVKPAAPVKVTNVKPATGGTLPFTGVDLTVALVGGMTLLGTGIVLRRASRKND